MNIDTTLERISKAVDQLPTNADVAELRDRVMQIEQKGVLRHEGHTGTTTSLGASVAAKFETLRDTFSTTKSVAFSVPLDLKSINAFAGSSIVGSHATLPGLSAPTGGNPGTMLIGNLPIRQTPGVATAHYSRYSAMSGMGASIQAGEGGSKTEAIPLFLDISQNAVTIAALCPISEQALRSTGELEAVVNGYLAGQVLRAADTMLIGGTAEASWPFAGYQPLATAYPSTLATISDAIADCVQNMRADGLNPDVVAVNAMTYLGIILLKNTGGDYLIPGALTSAPSDIRLHGCKVVFSGAAALVGKKALVIDSQQCELAVDGGMRVDIGHNNDNFARNLRTIRVEMSVIPTYRMIGAARYVSTTPA